MRVNPYVYLRDRCSQWAIEVMHPVRHQMFTYPKNKLE
jgi:hypothetical protein